jgi:hypothetical protein
MGRMECWNDGMLMKNWSDGVTWRWFSAERE